MDVSLMSDGYIHEVQYTSFKAWTDGGLISSYGKIPTIVVGPGYLESAHSAGEHIEIGELVPATLIYALTAVEFCG